MSAADTIDRGPLLTLAAKAQGAADDKDVARLECHLRSLTHVLAHPLRRYGAVWSRLHPAHSARLHRGRARVAASARALLREAAGGCPGPPERCASRAEALLALVTLQDRDERLCLRAVPVLVEDDPPSGQVRR